MNVLIIGGAGFFGTNLVYRWLAEPNTQVTVLDSLDPRFESTTDHLRDVSDRIQFVQGDLCDGQLMSDLVKDRDVIINCAGQTSHPLSLKLPLLDAQINCIGNLTLLEAVRAHNTDAVVIYTSSTTVIGKATSEIVDEQHPERPLDIYSANKGVAEKYYVLYHRVHGLKTVVLRFPNLYGPYGKGNPNFGFVNYFISLAWANDEITIYGTGRQTRNLLYVEDATELLVRAAQEPGLFGDVYFATGNTYRSVREIAESIVAVFERGKVTHIDWPDERLRIDVGDVRFSSDRLERLIEWQPQVDFTEGLEKTKAVLERISS